MTDNAKNTAFVPFIKSNIYNISSKNADVIFNGSALSSGLWSLPNLNFNDPNIRTVYFSIQHAEIPNTFYIINSSNDTLVILFSATTYTITLPHGNYNVNTFISTITPLMPTGLTWSYSSLTGKLTLLNSAGGSVSVLPTTTMNTIIGSGSATITGTTSLVMPSCVNFLPTARLNIRSSAFNIGNHGIDGASDIILTIQNNGGQTSRLLYQNYNNLRFLLEQPNVQQIDLRITIDNGSLCELNGVDWFITFQFDIEYFERPKINDFNKIVQSI